MHLAESFVPLALGMPLLSARRSQLLENLPAYVKNFGITHLGIVPSLIEATLNAAEEGVAGADIALRYIASGGEKMSDVVSAGACIHEHEFIPYRFSINGQIIHKFVWQTFTDLAK